jgi:hypothetical protein
MMPVFALLGRGFGPFHRGSPIEKHRGQAIKVRKGVGSKLIICIPFEIRLPCCLIPNVWELNPPHSFQGCAAAGQIVEDVNGRREVDRYPVNFQPPPTL